MRRYLFIDRDGTLVHEPEDEQVDSFEKIWYLPGIFTHLGRIVRQLDYELVMVTNQDGLGTVAHPEENFWPVHNRILETMAQEGIRFVEVLIDKSCAREGLDTRKPGTGMVRHYLDGSSDLMNSYVIGDRLTDVELAKNMGCGAILLERPKAKGQRPKAKVQSPKGVTFVAGDWKEIADYLIRNEKRAVVERKSRETQIHVEVSLYGSGQSDCSTGIGFFDHMIDQLARHSGADLTVEVQGDLHVDEHHTVEDTALVLGQAFRQAWGNLKGMQRYGFVLPMDDSEASVSIDLGGRPFLVWDAVFKREKVGKLPTELLPHFFRSFADGARATIHIHANGDNEHHKIEAIFKAVAKSLKQAWTSSGTDELPSTKGVIDNR